VTILLAGDGRSRKSGRAAAHSLVVVELDPEDPLPLLEPAEDAVLALELVVLTPPVPVPLAPAAPLVPAAAPAAGAAVLEPHAAPEEAAVLEELVAEELGVDPVEVDAVDWLVPVPPVPEAVVPEPLVPPAPDPVAVDPVALEPVAPEPVVPVVVVPEAVVDVVVPDPLDVVAGAVLQAVLGDPSIVNVAPRPAADDAAIWAFSIAASRTLCSALSGRLTGVSAAATRRVTVAGESVTPDAVALLWVTAGVWTCATEGRLGLCAIDCTFGA
jgi:hypothetical protein